VTKETVISGRPPTLVTEAADDDDERDAASA
jgi:hypothetical protein